MRGLAAIFFALSISTSAFAAPAPVEENPGREFIMSCTYGVLAGTLVGAASLAFTSRPGDNFNKVARGASIGLYTGILLGIYVVYIVPSMEASGEEPDPTVQIPPLWVEPLFTAKNQIDGVKADWTLLKF
jgi:hypothetical protein